VALRIAAQDLQHLNRHPAHSRLELPTGAMGVSDQALPANPLPAAAAYPYGRYRVARIAYPQNPMTAASEGKAAAVAAADSSAARTQAPNRLAEPAGNSRG
jgi:hypothetical protein